MLRMNSQEDDGQLSAQMIQTLVRMSQNIPAHVKVDAIQSNPLSHSHPPE